MGFCVKRLLSVQIYLQFQKYKIEKSITNSIKSHYHQMIYYPKYHFKFNHIEHFLKHLNNMRVSGLSILPMIFKNACLLYYQVFQITPV